MFDIACSDCTRWASSTGLRSGSCKTLIPSSTFDVHRGERRQDLQANPGWPAAAQQIPDPDAGKSAGLDLAAKIDDAVHQPAIGGRTVLPRGRGIRIIVLTRMFLPL